MLHQSTRAKVFDQLLSSLARARQGKRELDIIVSFVLGDTSSEAGKMIQLLVEEGYPWDVISDLLDEDLPAYTTSLDARVPGENVVLSAYSRKRKQWVAIHRLAGGEQLTAWAATECLARRLSGLQARQRRSQRAASQTPTRPAAPQAPRPKPSPRPSPAPRAAPAVPPKPPRPPKPPIPPRPSNEDTTESDREWRILF